MRPFLSIVLFLALAAKVLAGGENFDAVKPGELPAGWMAGVTGEGKADWAVVADPTATSAPNVLKQSGTAKYCWCVNTNLSIKNGRLQVRVKPVSGIEDEAGGLIWRFQDSGNYYIARANSMEDNITIYKTVQGVRKEYGRMQMQVRRGQWHTLRVEFNGPHFTVSFDGEFALAWDDDEFTKAGAVGVWTKADSVTAFDDFRWEEVGGK